MPSARHAMVGIVLTAAAAVASCEPTVPTEHSSPTALVATQSAAPDVPLPLNFVAHLIGPLAGHPFSDLIAAMSAGGTYVNVHTNDGVDGINTGPGDFPGGEIRGQIRLLGPTP